MIQLIGGQLYQWDVNRKVGIKDITHDKIPDKIHFANKGDSVAARMDYDANGVAIPAYLLQTGKPVCVYLFKGNRTIEQKIFTVYARPRPEDYIYENDQRNYVYELTEEAKAATKSANAAATLAYEAQEAANEAAEDARKAAEKVENIIDDQTTNPEKTWSSQKVSDLFANTRELIETGDEKVSLEAQLYVSEAIADEATRLEALMVAKDQQAALEMEMKMAADGVNASILKLGNDTSSAVVVSADSREDGFGVLRLDPLMEKPFPERDKNRVILRNVAPGKENNDAVNLGQLQEKVNETKHIVVTLFVGENTASHTAKEIKAFSNNGQPVFGAVFSDEIGEYTGELLNLSSVSNNAACFSSVTVFEQYAREDKYVVDENGFFQYDYTITNNVTKEQLDYAVGNLVTKEQFNGAVGDMETALDAIIAIQNGFLRIYFYIEDTEYFAQYGMTWREFINSEYNDGSFSVGYIEDDDVAFELVMIDGIEVYWDDKPVPPDDRIIENGRYSLGG